MKLIVRLVAGLALALPCNAAFAAFIFKVSESQGGVVVTGTGSIDLTDATLDTSSPGDRGSAIFPQIAGIGIGAKTADYDTYDATFLSADPFGPGGVTDATLGAGPLVILDPTDGQFTVPAGYGSGQLSASALYQGATFASLGLTRGIYTYGLANGDYFQVDVGPVPLPSSAAMLGATLIGLAGLGCVLKRRRAAPV